MDGFTGKEIELEATTEPIIGWRSWKVGYTYEEENGEITYIKPRLVSIAINPATVEETPWPPQQKAVAVHWGSPSSHHDETYRVPHPNCTCGYWAFKERTSLAHQYGPNPYAFGKVALWGKVIEGTLGWRGEMAYPQELNMSIVVQRLWNETVGDERDVVQELRNEYAIEVNVYENASFSD